MGKLIKWLLILAVAILVLSEVNLSTSLYKYEDNQIEIIFPRWRTESPWYYLRWNPGREEFIHRWHPEA